MIAAELLYEEGYRVAGRPDALPEAPHVPLDAYCAADHVLISPGGDMRGVIDDHLETLGRSRRVVLALPAFLPALAAVAASGALVTLPARVAEAFARGSASSRPNRRWRSAAFPSPCSGTGATTPIPGCSG